MEKYSRNNLNNIKNIFEEKTGVPLEKSVYLSYKSFKSLTVSIIIIISLFIFTCGYVVASVFDVNDNIKNFFMSYQKDPLSNGQNEYIDNYAACIGESVTQDGVTVTVTGAISDGTMAYILLDIVAQEDKNIEMIDGFNIEFEKLKLKGQENDSISSISTSCIVLEDNDGKKNTVSMMIRYNVYKLLGSKFTLADGKTRVLKLEDLFYHEDEYPYTLKTIAEGIWTFNIAFTPIEDKETELLNESFKASYNQISGKEVIATINSLKMKGLGATVYYNLPSNEIQEAGDFGIIEFTLKNGKKVYASPSKAGQTAETKNGDLVSGSNCHYCAYVFDSPIKYEEIDFIYIADNKIDIRQN